LHAPAGLIGPRVGTAAFWAASPSLRATHRFIVIA
jgi:hypothetical protein